MALHLADTFESLKKRASFGAFEGHFDDKVSAVNNNLTELSDKMEALFQQHAGLASTQPPYSAEQQRILDQGSKLKELKDNFDQARTKLEGRGELTATGWSTKNGKVDSAFDSAKKEYEASLKKFEDFLKGDSVKVDGRTVTVPDDIKDAFKNTKDSVAKIGETMNGMFSKFKVNGGFKEGFSKTIKENAERMAFWEEGASKAKVGTGEIAMRYGTVGLGTYLAGHALLVDKTRDDESKSVLSRVLEGGAGVLLVGGGLLAGRAV